MKLLYKCMCLLMFLGCKKDNIDNVSLASLLVVNSIQGGETVKVNLFDRDSVMAYNSQVFGIGANMDTVSFHGTSSILNVYYRGNVSLQEGGIYSVFLFGASNKVDTFMFRESLPAYYTDSTVGIRLINLCTGSGALHLTLAADTLTSIFENVTYKKLTNFIKISLRRIMPVAAVTFQVRSIDNKIVASYTLPSNALPNYGRVSVALSRNRNLTLVVKGSAGASGVDAPGIFPVANYF